MNTIKLSALELAIKYGLQKAWFQRRSFADDNHELEEGITEYLITVNVAQSVFEARASLSSPSLAVRLEYDADTFKRCAFVPFKTNPEHVVRSIGKAVRNGRIDLAILGPRAFQERASLSAVELKGLNPKDDKLNDDLDRLVDAIQAQDPVGINRVESGHVAFLQRLDTPGEVWASSNTLQRISEKKAKLEELCRAAFAACTHAEGAVDMWLIDENGVENLQEIYPDGELDGGDTPILTWSVVGVLISLKRKY